MKLDCRKIQIDLKKTSCARALCTRPQDDTLPTLVIRI